LLSDCCEFQRSAMGIKGLQGFVARVCPDVCRTVDLREMAEKHHIDHPDFPPTIVVDAMSCIRYWYTPESWVCGGQWREYLANLEDFIKAFMAAGIQLVFYFDGVVEAKKREEWIKRRLRNNKDIARIFRFVKTHKKQPGRGMFVVPSALPTFTRFALKSLGQKTVCTLQEADFEVAAYGLQHNCIGILGQDSDYLIYNTCPYFSIEKLRVDRLVTEMYSREDLCRVLGLSLTHLPLFACLLGNDIVPESLLEGFWHKCLVTSPHRNSSYDRRTNILLAVANYVSKIPCSHSSLKHLEEMLPLGSDNTLLYRGLESYILPGQQSPWIPPDVKNSKTFSLQQQTAVCQDEEIFQVTCFLKLNGHFIAMTAYYRWLVVWLAVHGPCSQGTKGSCAKNAEVEIALVENMRKLPINLYFVIFRSGSLSFRVIKISLALHMASPCCKCYQLKFYCLRAALLLLHLSCSRPVLPVGTEAFCSQMCLHPVHGCDAAWIMLASFFEQLAKEQHVQSENYAIFNILSNGEIECSNSLEDECDTEIPGQALIYRPARQHIYSVLLESGKDGAYPLVKEWFVYFGNPLQQPELIQPVQPSIPGGTPNLKTLWFTKGPDVEKQRYSTFLACFHLQDGMEELQALEAPVAALCCLLAYLMMQVSSLSLEDLNAFVAVALCLKRKSAAQLAALQLAEVDSRAVHLGAVFVRGLTTLLMANSACGFPFRMDDLMPWEVFDGKLFQEKYQRSHRGCSLEELLEGNVS
ncbi:F120B protein, partial [Crotophaga sulcirostris]|nr:F120B protein [Crotophaga sulcirostris]